MWIEETHWDAGSGWRLKAPANAGTADLVLYFGNRDALRCPDRYMELRASYPQAKIVGCSAQHSILGNAMREDGIEAIALGFSRTRLLLAHARLTNPSKSRTCGESIGTALAGDGLVAIVVLADGLRFAGSDLIAGLNSMIGPGVLVVGGMASDEQVYTEALVGADFAPQSGVVAAIGFYGDSIRFVHGRASGWDPFGPRRRITRSVGNVLYELDEKPAFELYQRYLAEEVLAGIPAMVLFPLLASPPDHPECTIVRANIGVDEQTGAMTFAGNLPEGWIVRLMRGNIDRLMLAAADAARQATPLHALPTRSESLALVVSCGGRQLLMGQRTEEELEAVGAVLPSDTKRIGFYSYGEIAPTSDSGASDVHNQTMAITTLYELET